MKTFLILFALIYSVNLFGQHPQVFISEEEVIEHQFKELIVTLDSASKGYRLPFDTIKHIQFNEKGKKVLQIGYTSDVVYIQNKTEFHYFQDSLEILRIDSSFNGPDFLLSTDTTITIHLFENEQLKTIRYFPWSRNNQLAWTQTLFYNQNGQVNKEVTVNEPLQINNSNVRVPSRSKSEVVYFYDKGNRLIETQTMSLRTDEEKRVQKNSYQYEENKVTKLIERQDFEGNTWISKEETFFDKEGKKIKILNYNKEGKVWSTTYFRYYDNGLLKEEESYDEGHIFAYRFLTIYK